MTTKGIVMERKSSPHVTPELAARIKHLALSLYQHQIAALLGINQGRVSEVLTGKVYPNIEPDQGSLAL